MKKLLMLILIILLFALGSFIAVRGINIGSVEILGVTGIKNKNDELDKKIQEAGKIIEKDYKNAVEEVETNVKKLQEEKKNYEDMIALMGEQSQGVNQIEKYEIESLWVKIGNHATSQGVELQMDVIQKDNSAQNSYDLGFTVIGSYISIIDFISEVENDTSLGFKIEEFKMEDSKESSQEEAGEKYLQATFVCKDVPIKEITEPTSTENEQNTEDAKNPENTENEKNTTKKKTNSTNTSKKNTNTNATNTNVAE